MVKCIIIPLHSITVPILYTGKYSPCFIFRPFCPRCQQANFRLNELLTILKLLLSKKVYLSCNCDSANFKMEQKKQVQKGVKKHGAKITLSTVPATSVATNIGISFFLNVVMTSFLSI